MSVFTCQIKAEFIKSNHNYENRTLEPLLEEVSASLSHIAANLPVPEAEVTVSLFAQLIEAEPKRAGIAITLRQGLVPVGGKMVYRNYDKSLERLVELLYV